MADAVLSAQIIYRGEDATQIATRALRGASEHTEGLMALSDELQALASGARNGTLSVRVDSHTGNASTRTITFIQGDCTAGDTFSISGHGRNWIFTAVASGPTAASGEYSIETDATAVAASVVAAMNAVPGFKAYWTPTSALGVVTITATQTGSMGLLGYVFDSAETTGTAIVEAAGVTAEDPGEAPSATITVVHANVDADDTITIGRVTLTWKAEPSGEDEIDIKTDATTDAAEVARAITAHSAFAGLVSATSSVGVVTITWLGADSRAGELVSLATSDATAHTLSGAFLDTNLTLTSSAVPRTYEQGGAP